MEKITFKSIIGLLLHLILLSISIFLAELFVLVNFESGLEFIDNLMMSDKYINWSLFEDESD